MEEGEEKEDEKEEEEKKEEKEEERKEKEIGPPRLEKKPEFRLEKMPEWRLEKRLEERPEKGGWRRRKKRKVVFRLGRELLTSGDFEPPAGRLVMDVDD